MALEVTTKDSTALSDSELAEMADICADGGLCYEVGTLSKQAEEWVLVTLVKEGNHLRGFSFSTLERIGGTPCILLGVAAVKRTSKRDAVLRAIIGDNFRRALMAFPDEDVLLGTRMSDAGALEGFKLLTDIVPRPGHKASGEERAWGRRLAKRFGVDAGRYDDQTFVATGDGAPPPPPAPPRTDGTPPPPRACAAAPRASASSHRSMARSCCASWRPVGACSLCAACTCRRTAHGRAVRARRPRRAGWPRAAA
jgi:hypothetical protein